MWLRRLVCKVVVMQVCLQYILRLSLISHHPPVLDAHLPPPRMCAVRPSGQHIIITSVQLDSQERTYKHQSTGFSPPQSVTFYTEYIQRRRAYKRGPNGVLTATMRQTL
jgi:hypothetical protein